MSHQEQSLREQKTGRGRKPTGNAKSTSQRVGAHEKALQAEGGERLGTVRISAEAVQALAILIEHYGTKKSAVENALIEQAKIIVGTNGN